MAWVVTPPTQTQASKTGWVTSPTTTPTTPQRGWLGSGQVLIMWGPRGAGALTVTTMARPFIAALLAGDGELFVDLLKREYRPAALTGDGQLRADYSQIHPAAPQFNSMGFLFGDTVSTHLEPEFSGDGALYGYWDGLTAVVGIGYGIDCFFSSEGTLVPSFETIYVLFTEFAAEGTLTGPLVPKLMADLAASGQLSATDFAVYVRTVALLASGTLSATDFAAYLRSIGFTGAGAFTNLLQILYTPAAGGAGTVSATTKQIYANAPAFSGGGTLSAEAFGGMLPKLTGLGTLSGIGLASYLRSVGLSGVGGLAGAGFPRYTRGFGDDFNRADSTTSAGPGWTNRLGVIGVSGNAAYAENSQTNWCIATPDTPMAGDDGEASIVVGPANASENMFVGLGLNAAGQGAFYYCNGSGHYIFNQDAWPVQWAGVASAAGATIVTGDRMTIRRVGNVYTGLLNGVPQVSWTDSGNLIPRDANHRLYEVGLYPGTRIVDTFYANDIGVLSGSGTASAATMQIAQIPTQQNVVVSPDFENDTAWQWMGGVQTTEQARSGTKSRKLTGAANWVQLLINNEPTGGLLLTPAAPGQIIHAECFVRAHSSNVGTGTVYLRIQPRDAAAADVGAGFFGTYWQSTIPNNGWLKMVADLVMPATTTQFYTDILLDPAVPTGDVFYFDDVGIYGNSAAGSIGTGTLSATRYPVHAVTANFSGGGTLSATATRLYTPTSETNTARTNQPIPAGTFNVRVSLIGAGGGGGPGSGGSFSARGGGGGGGGGAKLIVTLPVSSLGATYSVTRPLGGNSATAGAAATFVSGPTSVSAGGGGAGGTGTTSGQAAGGTGGVASAHGTRTNGGGGGLGGNASGSNGGGGTVGTNSGAGGGGGGGRNSIGTSYAGGTGGAGVGVTGGAGAGAGGSQGTAGGNASPLPFNTGGGGGGGAGSNGNNVTGGGGGDYGSGGGGGGGGNTVFQGGQGGDSYTLVEFL